jgi:GT2 family glycosyltransferase
MKLSVIFINDNSRNGLRLALNNLFKAKSAVTYEVIVVDNLSADRSLEMLHFEFPKVRVIANSRVESFSKNYNKAIRAAKGDYILLLNPYVLVNKDGIDKMVAFMDQHPLTGGASIRMVDFKGDYIAESKHSLSNKWVSFLRLVGMGAYFPKSISNEHRKTDWVEEFDTAEVDSLHEDCMLLRRSAIEHTGFFDERFKSYGYNIDLAYRLRKQGFKIYYYSKTYIIQLPGKVLHKFSWEYISHYYGAMFIFAAKYLFKRPVINLKDIGEIYPSSYEIE